MKNIPDRDDDGLIDDLVRRTIVADVERLQIDMRIDNLCIRSWDDHMTWSRVISARILGALIGHEKKTVQVPSDWWQHFKQRWFTRKMLRRWPVKMRDITFDAKAIVTNIPIDPNWSVMRLVSVEGVPWHG